MTLLIPQIRKQALLGLAHAIEHGPYSLIVYLGPHLSKLRPLIYDESKVVCRATVHLLLAVQLVKHPKVK